MNGIATMKHWKAKGKAAEDERLLAQEMGTQLDRALTVLAANEAKFISTQVCVHCLVCVSEEVL